MFFVHILLTYRDYEHLDLKKKRPREVETTLDFLSGKALQHPVPHVQMVTLAVSEEQATEAHTA